MKRKGLCIAIISIVFLLIFSINGISQENYVRDNKNTETNLGKVESSNYKNGKILIKVRSKNDINLTDHSIITFRNTKLNRKIESLGLKNIKQIQIDKKKLTLSTQQQNMNNQVLSDWHIADVSEGTDIKKLIKLISQESEIEVVEPDYIMKAYETIESTSFWGLERIGAQMLSNNIEKTSTNIIVAIVDTGVYLEHPLIIDRIVQGYDLVNNDNYPDDDNGHGTHVSGIVVKTSGDVPIKIMPIKVLDENGDGYVSDIGLGIRYAVDNGASIINLSLGGERYYNYIDECIEYALSKDVAVIVSAGNNVN